LDQPENICAVSVDQDDEVLAQVGPLLLSFVKVVEKYCQIEGSPPYWFNERACVSLLAAAAWQAGWVALEEYSTRKVMREGEDRRDRHGRCDLYIRSPGGLAIAIEAKHAMSSVEKILPEVGSALADARYDAMTLFRGEASTRLAVAFVTPGFCLASPPSDESINDICARIVGGTEEVRPDDLSSAPDSGFQASPRRRTHALVFPGSMRSCLGPAGLMYWPGVAMIVQRIKRGF